MGAPNYFELLALEPVFSIDLHSLEQSYFALQRQFHPDRFASKTALDRQLATAKSVEINDAYQTLKDPLKRAQYMLLLKGIRVGAERDTEKPPQHVLLQAMEWRERAEGSVSAEAKQHLKADLEQVRHECLENLAKAFTAAELSHATELTFTLQYCLKTLEELR